MAKRSNVVTVGAGQVNYVRNAVKATVDAYDGTVKLYGWDTTDPMLKAWGNAFPGSVRPISEISGELMSHIRYPQDMLKVQRELLTEYHVTNPGILLGNDQWRVARDRATRRGPAGHLPVDRDAGRGQGGVLDHAAFVPASNTERAARSCVSSPSTPTRSRGGQARRRLRLLRLQSRGPQPAGPAQVLNQVQSSPARSQNPPSSSARAAHHQQLESGKQLTFGNLLTFPLEGRMSTSSDLRPGGLGLGSFPQNKMNVAVYGTKIAWVTPRAGRSAVCSVPFRRATTSPPSLRARPADRPGQPGGDPARRRARGDPGGLCGGQEALKTGDFTAYDGPEALDAAISAPRDRRAADLRHTVAVAARSPSPSPSPLSSG